MGIKIAKSICICIPYTNMQQTLGGFKDSYNRLSKSSPHFIGSLETLISKKITSSDLILGDLPSCLKLRNRSDFVNLNDWHDYLSIEDENGLTNWYVLHAEANAILKTAASTHDCTNSTLYLTLSPCKECSKLIVQSKIKRLVYIDKYKDETSLHFLSQMGIEIEQITLDELSE